MNLTELLSFAIEITTAAGKLIQQKAQQPLTLHSKGFRDIVTDADFAAQELITTAVKKRYPAHGFLTEEEDETLEESGDWVWIIDPVDGTTNYSRRIPNYCVSVAVAKRVENSLDVQIGLVYDPTHDELYQAVKGGGATLNGKSLAVSQIDTLADAIFSLDWSRAHTTRQATLNSLNNVAHNVRSVRAVGTAALAICWIANGRLDSYLNYHLSAWDVAAAQLILHEAGGRVSDFTNQKWHWQQRHCLASNGQIHTQLCTHLQQLSGDNSDNLPQ